MARRVAIEAKVVYASCHPEYFFIIRMISGKAVSTQFWHIIMKQLGSCSVHQNEVLVNNNFIRADKFLEGDNFENILDWY